MTKYFRLRRTDGPDTNTEPRRGSVHVRESVTSLRLNPPADFSSTPPPFISLHGVGSHRVELERHLVAK